MNEYYTVEEKIKKTQAYLKKMASSLKKMIEALKEKLEDFENIPGGKNLINLCNEAFKLHYNFNEEMFDQLDQATKNELERLSENYFDYIDAGKKIEEKFPTLSPAFLPRIDNLILNENIENFLNLIVNNLEPSKENSKSLKKNPNTLRDLCIKEVFLKKRTSGNKKSKTIQT